MPQLFKAGTSVGPEWGVDVFAPAVPTGSYRGLMRKLHPDRVATSVRRSRYLNQAVADLCQGGVDPRGGEKHTGHP